MKTRMLQILSVMMVLGLVLSACQPQVVEVEKEVVVTQVVEKEVEVEKVVEVEVEKPTVDAIGFVDIAPGEPVHIAYMLATSGAVEFLGADSLGGIDIAIEEYGQLLGHDILLTGEDSLCSAEGGQTAATKVASDPTVLGVLGTNCSSAGTAASVVLSEAGMLMISPTNTSPALTDPNETWNPGYYRTAHNDKFQGRVAAEFAYNELGLTTAAALHDGDPYTEGLASVFADVFAELGGTVTSFEAINKGDTDMRPVLTSIGVDSPQALYFPIFEPEGNFVGAQSQEISGLENTVLMGADGLLVKSFGPNTGEAAVGMYLSGPYVSEDVSAYASFLEKYEANTGGPPPAGFAAHAYDGANILLGAIERVAIQDADGTLHIGRQALRDAVGSTYRYGGLTGILSCDEYGDCATGEALAVFRLSADNVASADNWPPEVVYTPSGGAQVAVGGPKFPLEVVRFSLPGALSHFNPSAEGETSIGGTIKLISGKLLRFDMEGVAQPDLAELDISDDGLTYTFTLVDNAKYSDGSDVTVEDVLFAWENSSSDEICPACDKGMISTVESVEAVGDNQIVWNLSSPQPDILYWWPKYFFSIHPKDLVEADPVGYWQKPTVSAGPYVISDGQAGDPVVTLQENPYYARGPMSIQTLELHWIPDQTARALMLSTGEIDFVYELPPPTKEIFPPEVDTMVMPFGGVFHLSINQDLPDTHCLSDVRVRKAISLQMDRAEINQRAVWGIATPATGYFFQGSPIDIHVLENDGLQDTAAAKALMAETDWADGGCGFAVTTYGPRPWYSDGIMVLAEQLKELNMEVTADPLDFGPALSKMAEGEDYEAGWAVTGNNGGPPSAYLANQFSTGFWAQRSRINDPDMNALFDELNATVEQGARDQIMKDIQVLGYELQTIIPCCERSGMAGTRIGTNAISTQKGASAFVVNTLAAATK